jgi:hypothetical protein
VTHVVTDCNLFYLISRSDSRYIIEYSNIIVQINYEL